MAEARIGCSGFNYPHWRERFYPPDLAQRNWLDYYCSVFKTVELNVTFYRLPLEKTFERWRSETPADFAFALKGSRFITHIKRLIDPEQPLELFFQRASLLKAKLKVVLWQLPPSFDAHIERLSKFLRLLQRYPVRNTIEFRHPGWITEDVIGLCRESGVALCMADWPEFIDDLPVTSDFIYIRRHGAGGSYASCYSNQELKKDAHRVRNYLKQGKDIFIYFNNDAHAYAPLNARQLIGLLR